MLQTFDKAIKLHQTACFYNELRGYPYISFTKLLQKREMRKDIVIELSYKGFSRASDYS